MFLLNEQIILTLLWNNKRNRLLFNKHAARQNIIMLCQNLYYTWKEVRLGNQDTLSNFTRSLTYIINSLLKVLEHVLCQHLDLDPDEIIK